MHALVSGASMAGLSCAHWLPRVGYDVTVVERSTDLRQGGAPIDVRGEALQTAERMGILDRVRGFGITAHQPMPVYGADGSVQAAIDLTWFANECPDDIELTRDDLLTALRESVDADVSYRFGVSISEMNETAADVEVQFSSGDSARYDLVVGADGLHSTVRRNTFGPEAQFLHHLGFYVALVNLDPHVDWQAGMYTVPGLSVSVRLDCGQPLAYVMFASAPLAIDYRDVEGQRRIVSDVLRDHEVWQIGAVRATFADAASPGFYYDSIAQTRMDRWSTRRIALVGDAAHCASLLSGLGSTLAMTGAERLAQALARTSDITAALADYEATQRPLVTKAQHSALANASIMVPRTEAEVTQRNNALREMQAAADT